MFYILIFDFGLWLITPVYKKYYSLQNNLNEHTANDSFDAGDSLDKASKTDSNTRGKQEEKSFKYEVSSIINFLAEIINKEILDQYEQKEDIQFKILLSDPWISINIVDFPAFSRSKLKKAISYFNTAETLSSFYSKDIPDDYLKKYETIRVSKNSYRTIIYSIPKFLLNEITQFFKQNNLRLNSVEVYEQWVYNSFILNLEANNATYIHCSPEKISFFIFDELGIKECTHVKTHGNSGKSLQTTIRKRINLLKFYHTSKTKYYRNSWDSVDQNTYLELQNIDTEEFDINEVEQIFSYENLNQTDQLIEQKKKRLYLSLQSNNILSYFLEEKNVSKLVAMACILVAIIGFSGWSVYAAYNNIEKENLVLKETYWELSGRLVPEIKNQSIVLPAVQRKLDKLKEDVRITNIYSQKNYPISKFLSNISSIKKH